MKMSVAMDVQIRLVPTFVTVAQDMNWVWMM